MLGNRGNGLPNEITEFQDTPNPNAAKAVLARPLPASGEGLRSYGAAADAAGDPLGAALMAVPGVRNVLIHREWITVGREPGAPWEPIREGVRRVLREQA